MIIKKLINEPFKNILQMKKLEEIRSTMLVKEILTTAQASQIKGGSCDEADDEKRRARPGGGVGTHSGIAPTC